MKKTLFLLALFSVAGIVIYYLMVPPGSPPPAPPPPPPPAELSKILDSVKTNEWKSNSNYLRVKTTIGLFESNGKISSDQKQLCLTTLDINYAFALTKKYNAIKTSFTSFPSPLYNEMVAFQSKNSDLPTGVRELSAFIQLQNLEGSVNQTPEIRYSSSTMSNLKSKINNLPLGALNSNSYCKGIKMRYLNKLSAFENDISELDPLIDIAERPNSDFNEYKRLAYNKSILNKYIFYRNWLNNNEYRFNSN
jgi:hypothetical protein